MNSTHNIPVNVDIEIQSWIPSEMREGFLTANPNYKILEIDEDGTNPMNGTKKPAFKVIQESTKENEVWKCEFCNAYSKEKDKVLEHEKVCNYKPKEIQ